MSDHRRIAVIGLGYVGLPVAVAFARGARRVVAFDIDRDRIAELLRGADRTNEVDADELCNPALMFTDDPAHFADVDFFVVTVPTPIDSARNPDLGAMLAASRSVGRALKRGDIVVYESTVYPGAIEEECVPVLESVSGLRAGSDFKVAYSPERINPGDQHHRFETIVKVVSAQDSQTLDIVANVYGSVVTAGIHRAPSIKVAEAAKVIENTQRDLNIAFMNELALIFRALNIDTADVLAAASTKWNFLPFEPGLVGGHCIGVDPYYLTSRAQRAGYHPEVILAGRRTNDSMGQHVARECIRGLLKRKVHGGLVTVLGLTFKENVPDLRNSRVVDIIRELQSFGLEVQMHDPHASAERAKEEYGLTLTDADELRPAHAVILAVPHQYYLRGGWMFIQRLLGDGNGLVLDIKTRLDRLMIPPGIELWRL
ncbi:MULTISPECIES: nucleotide sugar dehydrogenase [unclassified Bradyrhizobium]|uniref:nucleotide sugar dehydrogenase n=1 Tax=unclassified Bradyrhizobium TaxID=2631580 RepID=UPI001FF3385B|nr:MULTISPECIES: nucleotide sugar dehydrogenase [unclassified Bradyrhizobium]MCJ9700061.1 nucleotide sugar dehydrogenase [Bradyrhizobium sp. SHOUNA76]MCJ9729089.1 nucleotide sugar dehydrogenase [Bradyrhizobium sp. PRIMUS42]